MYEMALRAPGDQMKVSESGKFPDEAVFFHGSTCFGHEKSTPEHCNKFPKFGWMKNGILNLFNWPVSIP